MQQRCPVCGNDLHRTGLESLQQGRIVIEWECLQCHYRTVFPQEKKFSRL